MQSFRRHKESQLEGANVFLCSGLSLVSCAVLVGHAMCLEQRAIPVMLCSRILEIPHMSPYCSNKPNFLLEMLPSNVGKQMFVFLLFMLHKRRHRVEQRAQLCAQDLEWKHRTVSLGAVLRIQPGELWTPTLVLEVA